MRAIRFGPFPAVPSGLSPCRAKRPGVGEDRQAQLATHFFCRLRADCALDDHYGVWTSVAAFRANVDKRLLDAHRSPSPGPCHRLLLALKSIAHRLGSREAGC